MLVHTRVEGDTLVLNSGDQVVYKALQKQAGIAKPKEWLTAHLSKNGPDKLFPVEKQRVWTRKKA